MLHEWNDGAVLYDDSDASLKALSVAAAAALRLLMDGVPRSTESVAQELLGPDEFTELTPNDHIDSVAMVENALMHLHSLRLLRRHSH